MAQIIKFPAQTPKCGYKRVGRRRAGADDPNQLQLFAQPSATILRLDCACRAFEQALRLDELDDPSAEDLYRKAIEEQDCVADAYCNLGILQSRRGETAKAFDSFANCLKHNPRHFEAHYNLGNLYFDNGDHRLAQIHFQIAAEIDPTFPNLHFNLALALAVNNELQAAIGPNRIVGRAQKPTKATACSFPHVSLLPIWPSQLPPTLPFQRRSPSAASLEALPPGRLSLWPSGRRPQCERLRSGTSFWRPGLCQQRGTRRHLRWIPSRPEASRFVPLSQPLVAVVPQSDFAIQS